MCVVNWCDETPTWLLAGAGGGGLLYCERCKQAEERSRANRPPAPLEIPPRWRKWNPKKEAV